MASLAIENIVLFGRTGNGKSATGNSIAGKTVFVSQAKAESVTKECKAVIVERAEGPKLRLIDTPGFLDTSKMAEELCGEVVKCLHLAEGGLHAVLLVLTAKTRFTKDEEIVLRTLQVIFGSKIVDNLIIVYTAGEELDEGQTIQNYLEPCPEFLKKVLESCENRVAVFQNRTHDDAQKKKQVQDLLNIIDKLRKKPGYKPYTEDMYLKIKEEADRHQKEKEEAEKKQHEVSPDEFEKILQMILEANKQNIKAMSDNMEKSIRLVLEAQAKLIEHMETAEELREEGADKRHHEEMMEIIDKMDRDHQEEMKNQMANQGGGGCSIL